MQRKLITVFGGSGFVGRYVVKLLAAQGHRVRVAVRNPNLALFLKPMGDVGQVQLTQANLRHAPSVAAAVAGADAVVNLVAVLASTGAQTLSAVNVDGAATVAQAARDHGIETLVQLSALGADADSEIAYLRSRGQAERAVREIFPRATILRPSIIFGAEDKFLNQFASLARLPFLMMPVLPVFAPEAKLQPVFVQDVAQAVVAAVNNPASAAQVYELGGPEVVRMREIMALAHYESYSSKTMFDVPAGLAKILATTIGILPGAPISRDSLKMLEQGSVVGETAKTFADLGITPTAMDVVAPHYLARYRPRGQFAPKRAPQTSDAPSA